MDKMRIAFYRADEGGYDDKFIDRFSGDLGYSHCEIVLSSTSAISAHMQAGGVKKFTYPNLYHSRYWDIYELDIPYVDEAIEYALSLLNTKYDTLGVALKFIGINIKNDEKVWCSEFMLDVLNIALQYSYRTDTIRDSRIMPNDAFILINERFNPRLISNSYSLESTFGSHPQEVDRWGRVKVLNKPSETSWFWRLFG